MLKRGYCIGVIIDELTSIVEKAKFRAKLNLNDLSIYSESFFGEVINIVYGLELKNLNTINARYPAVDIGDKLKKIAYQVSLTVNNTKISDTIRSINNNTCVYEDYTDIRFFVVGEKQKNYNSIIENNYNINEKKIIDINDLCREIIGLDIKTLERLKKYIEEESSKVKIDFEIPDENGNYETSLYNYLENIPKENIDNYAETLGYELDEEQREEDKEYFMEFIKKLKVLPRITREFLAIVVDLSEWKSTTTQGNYAYVCNLDIIKKKLSYDFISDMSLVCDNDLLSYEIMDDTNYHEYKCLQIKDDTLIEIAKTAKEKEISSKIYLVTLDFTN